MANDRILSSFPCLVIQNLNPNYQDLAFQLQSIGSHLYFLV